MSLDHTRQEASRKPAGIVAVSLSADTSERLDTITHADQRLRLAMDLAKLYCYSWDPNTDDLHWDHGLRKIWGLKPGAPVNHDVWYQGIHPDDRLIVEQALACTLDPAGDGYYETEYRVCGKDGVLRWVGARGQTTFVRHKASSHVGVAQEITERKLLENQLAAANAALNDRALQLEQTVAERTAKLRDAIDSLEHFSYTITHDMRAPLRAIQGFAAILRAECEHLPSAQQRSLDRIMEASRRMDGLITDALQYAGAINADPPLGPVDPVRLLRGTIESYPALLSPNVQILVKEPMPLLRANEAWLNQCFSNLLGNAVKFVSPGVDPRVAIWSEDRGAFVRLWFEDNGIGIKPEHQGRIFNMFQRLSTRYEGTGIGLALVRKVIQRMGGQTGVESEPGIGSRFWIELGRA